jgi:DNA-binding XRE family transcriptional regulator
MDNTFGQQMKRYRIIAKMSLQDVSNIVGISKQALSRYESGKTKPDSEFAGKIADALGTTTNNLFWEPQIRVELSNIKFFCKHNY